MPRIIKCRRICAEPLNTIFLSQDPERSFITLSVDELESLRLCDLEGLDQEDAAQQMDISRGTLQRILYSARKHVAEALTNGSGIVIEGGQYKIANEHCNCADKCKKCEYKKENEEEK